MLVFFVFVVVVGGGVFVFVFFVGGGGCMKMKDFAIYTRCQYDYEFRVLFCLYRCLTS